MNNYHNTTAETDNLMQYEGQALTQDDAVFNFFNGMPGIKFTCEDVHAMVMPNSAPLTSARRAVSNLYNQGIIEKAGKVQGKFGRPIYLWRLK